MPSSYKYSTINYLLCSLYFKSNHIKIYRKVYRILKYAYHEPEDFFYINFLHENPIESIRFLHFTAERAKPQRG